MPRERRTIRGEPATFGSRHRFATQRIFASEARLFQLYRDGRQWIDCYAKFPFSLAEFLRHPNQETESVLHIVKFRSVHKP